jgi:hypothetical protein
MFDIVLLKVGYDETDRSPARVINTYHFELERVTKSPFSLRTKSDRDVDFNAHGAGRVYFWTDAVGAERRE